MRLCARGGGDSSHAASDCVGRGKCWQVGRAISTRSELLMSGEKSMPTRELLHLGAEVAVMVVGEAVVCGGLEKRRGKCVGRAIGSVQATCLVPPLDTVFGAHQGGGAGSWQRWEEETSGKKTHSETCSAHAQSSRATRSARLRQRFLPSTSDKNNHRVALCSGQEMAWYGAPICVSCLDDRYPWVLLVKTVLLFVVCFSHQLTSTRSPTSSSHTRSSTSARHCLLRLEASARRRLAALNRPSNVDHDEAATSFPICVLERAVALTDELLVMHSSRRLVARAHTVSRDRMEKDKEQQRLQFNSVVENDDERRRPECNNGTISGEEIEDLDSGSFCGDRSQTGEVFKNVLSQSEYFKNQAKKTMSKNVLVTMVTKPGSVFLIPEIVERLRHCERKVNGVEDAVFVLSRDELETFLKKYSDGGILSDDGKVCMPNLQLI